MTTLAKDELGELQRQREAIISEIHTAEAKLYSSMEQIRRVHYRRLGELFIQFRMTFPKGEKGDREFTKECRHHFPGIKDSSREEYITYRKRLKGAQRTAAVDLPPLRHLTSSHKGKNDVNRARDQYRRIVDEEVEDVKAFERTPEINEAEAIQEVAQLIITTGFKVLAVKMHPDKDGGSNEAMRRLNKAKKLLQDALIRVAAQLI
jgi:hypothetical protein